VKQLSPNQTANANFKVSKGNNQDVMKMSRQVKKKQRMYIKPETSLPAQKQKKLNQAIKKE